MERGRNEVLTTQPSLHSVYHRGYQKLCAFRRFFFCFLSLYWECTQVFVSQEYFIALTFRPQYGSWVDSASNRNEYQEYFLEIKAAGA
jgi:hypothetical protein